MKALHSALLHERASVAHGFFTRSGGVSEGIYASLNCGLGSHDDPDRVRENLARVAEHFAVRPQHLVTLAQTHSCDVHVIDRDTPAGRPRADALVTARAGVALGITGADCPTVLLADSRAAVIGAAHAGWRGALHGVLEATVTAMRSLGARSEHMTVAIGPGIQRDSYTVGEEFRATFRAHDAAGEVHFTTDGGTLRFDLPGYIEQRLRRLGLPAVDRQGRDTFSDTTLFSYRRSRARGEPDYGRSLGVIVLSP